MSNWRANRRLEEAFVTLIEGASPSYKQEAGLRETPQRACTAWLELTRGYSERPDLKTFPAEGQGIITIKDISFHSLCEHHLLPFFGTVSFAYIPDEHILGLSKFARLTEVYSRRLQVQERLTKQLLDALQLALHPEGVMVISKASHLCMTMRGVQKMGQTAIVSEVSGAFRENPETRAEAMRLLHD